MQEATGCPKKTFVIEWCFFLLAKVSRDTRESSLLPSLHQSGPRDSQALGSSTGLARGVSAVWERGSFTCPRAAAVGLARRKSEDR